MIIIGKQYANALIVSERLKRLRKEKGLTQKTLADAIHFSISTIKQYEAGNRVPDRKNLSEIAKFFNVSESYLLGETEYKSILEEVDARLGEIGRNNLRFDVELVRRFNKSFNIDIALIPQESLAELDKEIRDFINYKLTKYR